MDHPTLPTHSIWMQVINPETGETETRILRYTFSDAHIQRLLGCLMENETTWPVLSRLAQALQLTTFQECREYIHSDAAGQPSKFPGHQQSSDQEAQGKQDLSCAGIVGSPQETPSAQETQEKPDQTES